MTNYVLNVQAVIDKPLKLTTGSYTFTDPEPFTVYLPAYLYNDRDQVVKQDEYVLIREQKDTSFNAIGFWGGQYASNGHKILYAEPEIMAAAILTIINKDHVYIRYRKSSESKNSNGKNPNSKKSKSEYYQFAYELNSKELRFFFDETHRGRNLEAFDSTGLNKENLDDFEYLITQVRIAELIYYDLSRTLHRDPNKLLAVVIQENRLLQQQLGTVEVVSCDNFRCATKQLRKHKVH